MISPSFVVFTREQLEEFAGRIVRDTVREVAPRRDPAPAPAPDNTRPLYLTLRKASHLYSISPERLRELIKRGTLSAYRNGRNFRVRVAELEEFLRSGQEEREPTPVELADSILDALRG